MLRASLLANAEILPQARQGSYFFNRIGQKPPFNFYKSKDRFEVCKLVLIGTNITAKVSVMEVLTLLFD